MESVKEILESKDERDLGYLIANFLSHEEMVQLILSWDEGRIEDVLDNL